MDQYPICVLPPSSFAFRPEFEGATGPKPVSGPGLSADLSAGGFWVCEQTLDLRANRRGDRQLNAFYATLARLMTVSPAISVRWLAQPIAPWIAGQRTSLSPTPHSDGAFFSDGTGYFTGSIRWELAQAASLNDTEIYARRLAGGDLVGGEPFTLVGDYDRLHLVGGVTLEDAEEGVWRIPIWPDLRQDYVAGATIDFERPRCAMSLPIAGAASAFPTISLPGYLGQGQLQLAEYLPEYDPS